MERLLRPSKQNLEFNWEPLEPLEAQTVIYEFQHEYDSAKINSLFREGEKVYYSGNLESSQILKVLYFFIFTLLLVGFISSLAVGCTFFFIRHIHGDYYFAFIISGMEFIGLVIFSSMYAFIYYKKNKFSKFLVTQERVIIIDKYHRSPIRISYFSLNKLRKVIFHIPIRGSLRESIDYIEKHSNERIVIDWAVPSDDGVLSGFDDKSTLFTTYSHTVEKEMRRIFTLLQSVHTNPSLPTVQAIKFWKTSILFGILLVAGFVIIFGIYLAIAEFIRVGDFIVFCFLPMGIFTLLFYSISLIYYSIYVKRKCFHVEFDFSGHNSIHAVSYQTFSDTTFII